MKKYLLLLALLLAACSPQTANAQTVPGSATPSPVALQNYEPTIAALQTQSAGDRWQAVESGRREVAYRETAIASGIAVAQLTATLAADERSYSATSQAVNSTAVAFLVVATQTSERVGVEKINASALLAQEQRLAKAQDGSIVAINLMAVAFFLFASMLFLFVVRSWRGQLATIEKPAIVAERGRFVAGINLEIFDGIISIEKLEKIVDAIAGGAHFSHGSIVLAMQICTETEFTALQDVFVRYGLAEWRRTESHRAGCKLTEKGRAFLAALTPPLPLCVQNMPVFPSEDTIPTGFSPLSSGGVVENDEN